MFSGSFFVFFVLMLNYMVFLFLMLKEVKNVVTYVYDFFNKQPAIVAFVTRF